MSKQNIKINDFELFFTSIRALNKIAESAKFTITADGLTIYGRNQYSRCELTTDSIVSENGSLIEFCIADLAMFVKVLGTVFDVHKDDCSEIMMFLDFPFIKIESGKFKTKLNTCKEDIISNSISQKVKTELKSIFEFTTSTKQIKYINSHSYIVNDTSIARIYLNTDKDMENNVVYAKIGNESNELNNSMTLKLGLVTYGSLDDRTIILNFDRLNAFNVVESDNIEVQLMDKNVLVTNVFISGRNESSCKIKMYVSILVN